MRQYLYGRYIVEIVISRAITLCGVKIVGCLDGDSLLIGMRTVVDFDELVEVSS